MNWIRRRPHKRVHHVCGREKGGSARSPGTGDDSTMFLPVVELSATPPTAPSTRSKGKREAEN